MTDIIIRNAPDNEAAILQVRAAKRAMSRSPKMAVGDSIVVGFDSGEMFSVTRTKAAYVVREEHI